MTDRKLRVLHVLVQPVLVYDDGEELHPGPQTQPQMVSLRELAEMGDRVRAEVAAFEAQQAAEG